MFRFFRAIRKQLLEEGKLLRYFYYALGEILLVVTGILIALQIDNWNDDRLQRIEEQVLIKNLREEFEANLNELIIDIERVSEVYNGLKELLDVMSSIPEGYTEDDIDELLYKSFVAPDWDPSSYVLSDLKNSGRLSTISNNELKQLLFDWERLYEGLLGTEESYAQYAGSYYEYITRHGSTRNVDSYFSRRNLSKSSLEVSNLELLDKPEFESTVSNFFALTDSLNS